MEYLALVAEIETLKGELAAANAELATLKPKPKAKPVKVPCPHVTGKGQQCKKYCAPGLTTCKVHGRPPKTKPPPKPKPVKVVCTGLNMRGNPCKRKVLAGCTYCDKHDPSLPPKEKKGKGKGKKQTPQHNHGIGEKPEVPCGLCGTHGDMFDPGVTEAVWVDEAEFWARRGGLRE